MENRGVIKRELPHFPHPELPSLSASFAMVDCSLLEILPSGGTMILHLSGSLPASETAPSPPDL